MDKIKITKSKNNTKVEIKKVEESLPWEMQDVKWTNDLDLKAKIREYFVSHTSKNIPFSVIGLYTYLNVSRQQIKWWGKDAKDPVYKKMWKRIQCAKRNIEANLVERVLGSGHAPSILKYLKMAFPENYQENNYSNRDNQIKVIIDQQAGRSIIQGTAENVKKLKE